MRFTVSDWLLLAVACAVASVAMAGVTWVIWEGRSQFVGPRSPGVLALVMVTVGVIATLVDGLATWLVLRRCVDGLRLGHWLLAIAVGFALKAVTSLPAIALSLPPPLLSLSDIAGSVAILLPLGFLLQRLTGASAWPLIVIASLATISVGLARPALIPYLVVDLGLSRLGMALVSGIFTGLILGAGLFLMARRPAQATRAG